MNDLMTKSFQNYVELKKQAREDTAAELAAAGELSLTAAGELSLTAAGELSLTADEPNLAEFFLKVDSIKTDTEEITNLLSELQTLNEETKSSHSAKILRGLRDRIQSDIVTVLRKAKDVKSSLEALEKSNISNRGKSHLYAEGSPVDRTRVSVTNGLRAKFREAMNEFLFLREKILSDYKKDLKRKYFVATGEEANEETIQNMVSGKWGFESLVVEKKDKEMDLPCKERHQAVLDIQRSLTKLHQVFLDMAVLVDAQGEKIDDIEENVAKASEFVAGGTDALYDAKQMKDKKRATCTCWWVVAAIFVVLLVCLISLLAS